jgi:acetolactate synthase-1/3 small subunit
MRHIISAVVDNKPGVLARIAGLFSARGFNIESLAVGETEDPARSRMTVVVAGDDAVLEQVRKQLSKLVDTIKVSDFSGVDYIERDLMLVKIRASAEQRGQVLDIVRVHRGKIVDLGEQSLVAEVSGTEAKIAAFLRLVEPYGVIEMVRTGRIAIARGE